MDREKVLIYFTNYSDSRRENTTNYLDSLSDDKSNKIEVYTGLNDGQNIIAERYGVKTNPTFILFERKVINGRDDLVEISRLVGHQTRPKLLSFIKGEENE